MPEKAAPTYQLPPAYSAGYHILFTFGAYIIGVRYEEISHNSSICKLILCYDETNIQKDRF